MTIAAATVFFGIASMALGAILFLVGATLDLDWITVIGAGMVAIPVLVGLAAVSVASAIQGITLIAGLA